MHGSKTSRKLVTNYILLLLYTVCISPKIQVFDLKHYAKKEVTIPNEVIVSLKILHLHLPQGSNFRALIALLSEQLAYLR